MRVAGEAAIRWRAGVTSFQMSMQMFVRTLLCAVGIWLASTIALVWYWTGYYFGAIAHQFFGRWLLSWVLGRVIPLYFLTLPYRGALSDREHLRLSEPKDLLSFLPGLVLALRTVGADSNRTAGRGYSVCVRATHEQRRQSHPRDRNHHTETAEFTATR